MKQNVKPKCEAKFETPCETRFNDERIVKLIETLATGCSWSNKKNARGHWCQGWQWCHRCDGDVNDDHNNDDDPDNNNNINDDPDNGDNVNDDYDATDDHNKNEDDVNVTDAGGEEWREVHEERWGWRLEEPPHWRAGCWWLSNMMEMSWNIMGTW